MAGWLPAEQGPGAARSRTTTARLLDSSWLADQQFFCPIVRLRAAGIRSHWRVAGARQSVALSLYGIDEGKSAAELKDLVPKYLPAGLPTDPYSGQPFRYRVAANGQATLWSTGPDRIDHGARNNGAHLTDEDARWSRGEFDLVTPVHHWP